MSLPYSEEGRAEHGMTLKCGMTSEWGRAHSEWRYDLEMGSSMSEWGFDLRMWFDCRMGLPMSECDMTSVRMCYDLRMGSSMSECDMTSEYGMTSEWGHSMSEFVMTSE